MKHLKLFESFRKEDIHDIFEEYGIEDYTINEDGSIDVDEGVDLEGFNLTKLPLKFKNVSNYFDCQHNNLTSIEGCPTSVGDDFICNSNKLTSLEGCPKSVGSNFDCSNNKLTSLEGCPKSVVGNFDCSHNKKIATFEHLPPLIGNMFNCIGNPIYKCI